MGAECYIDSAGIESHVGQGLVSRSQNLKGRRACSCYLVFHLCPTLWDPMDCNPLGSSVHGISQARTLEWVAFPSPGDLPNPGIKSVSPALQAGSLLLSHCANRDSRFLLSLKTKTCLICGYFTLRREESPPDKDCCYPGDIPGVEMRSFGCPDCLPAVS